jgi:hypothetical protein
MDMYEKKLGGTWIIKPKPPKSDIRKMIQSMFGDIVGVTMKVRERYLGGTGAIFDEVEVRSFLRSSLDNNVGSSVVSD